MEIKTVKIYKLILGGFNIITHDVFYSISNRTQNGRQNFKELIITNYDIT